MNTMTMTMTEEDRLLIEQFVAQMCKRFDEITAEESRFSPVERRRDPRIEVDSELKIAFLNANCIPDDSGFVEVKSRDISKRGCSFWFHKPPPQKHCLVLMEVGTKKIMMLARIVYSQLDDSTENQYIIGCSFSKRVDQESTEKLF